LDIMTLLFERIAALPRVRLGLLPTPLMRASRLTETLGGPQFWIKRDDMTGFGFGGNKVRGLEFLLADALAQGADTLVTGAGPQSNHVRATAAAAAHAGLGCVAVHFGAQPTAVEGNFRLARMLGAEQRFTNDPDRSSVDRGIEAAVAELRAAGRHPYSIPRGGAHPLGVLGYVLAARELAEQCAAQQIIPAAIVLATGSCGSHAGLLLGLRALGLDWKVEGFTVSRPATEARARVLMLANTAAERLGVGALVGESDVIVHDGVIGEGYGIPTPEGNQAIQLVARNEGIFLDPTYSGKAMAGLIAAAQAGYWQREQTVIFVHTGGEPALFVG
jgi:D-cysteine desulfhydrase family pyridoxal phosphate-dependent enzyme